jgi:hypothetical protein
MEPLGFFVLTIGGRALDPADEAGAALRRGTVFHGTHGPDDTWVYAVSATPALLEEFRAAILERLPPAHAALLDVQVVDRLPAAVRAANEPIARLAQARRDVLYDESIVNGGTRLLTPNEVRAGAWDWWAGDVRGEP